MYFWSSITCNNGAVSEVVVGGQFGQKKKAPLAPHARSETRKTRGLQLQGYFLLSSLPSCTPPPPPPPPPDLARRLE